MYENILTPHQALFLAALLTRRVDPDSEDALATTIVDAQININPHQVEAALFAMRNPFSRGVLLADEVGLGKTIEAGLVIAQRWSERRRKILILTPASLRKQWHQEMQDKFGIACEIFESARFNFLSKEVANPFLHADKPIICSYQFAKSKSSFIAKVDWQLIVFDEAHHMRNVYKPKNVIARTIRDTFQQGQLKTAPKILLTATPMQNTTLELYGLVSIIDDRIFGELDSFRARFGTNAHLMELRNRIKTICTRTLRSQVQQYTTYTNRFATTFEFEPHQDEKKLVALVSDYLRRPKLRALPSGQRRLISLVLWKLLASSSHAIAGALANMANRLEASLPDRQKPSENLIDVFAQDYETLDETLEEWNEPVESIEPELVDPELCAEIAELRKFEALAKSIRLNGKGECLLGILGKAFEEIRSLATGKDMSEERVAPEKAIIFTESRLTQEYLYDLLKNTVHGEGLVLFNGSNTDARAVKIYKAWLEKHKGTHRVSGSKSADTRQALVDYFRDQGSIMIATEAAAEGINLQFCALVINYDLPWNPQRIEQRIGRCHRYGQKFDVVVVNFIDTSNEASRLVYKLLDEKFKLFNGVFGASDEVLGAIGSGIDVESRIAEIYTNCREPHEIVESFNRLRSELAPEIETAMANTSKTLLENFNEEVRERLKVLDQTSNEARGRYEKWLLRLGKSELQGHAIFDADGFTLHSLPDLQLEGRVPLGRYELPRRKEEAYLFRIGDPLASWFIERAKAREPARQRLIFDYQAHGELVTDLLPLRGKSGLLALYHFTVKACQVEEDYLTLAVLDSDNQPIDQDVARKLLLLPATACPLSPNSPILPAPPGEPFDPPLPPELLILADTCKNEIQKTLNIRNLKYFEQEASKIDADAEDRKLLKERELTEIEVKIKELRRSSIIATTLEEKLHFQREVRDREKERTKLRRDLFESQDEIEAQRNAHIDELERQLKQEIDEKLLFVVEWELN